MQRIIALHRKVQAGVVVRMRQDMLRVLLWSPVVIDPRVLYTIEILVGIRHRIEHHLVIEEEMSMTLKTGIEVGIQAVMIMREIQLEEANQLFRVFESVNVVKKEREVEIKITNSIEILSIKVGVETVIQN